MVFANVMTRVMNQTSGLDKMLSKLNWVFLSVFQGSFLGRRLASWFPIQARQTNHFNFSAKWNDPLKWWQGCVYWAMVLIGPCGSSQKTQPYKCARLGCGHPSPGPKGGGNRVESNRTTLWGNWQQLTVPTGRVLPLWKLPKVRKAGLGFEQRTRQTISWNQHD